MVWKLISHVCSYCVYPRRAKNSHGYSSWVLIREGSIHPVARSRVSSYAHNIHVARERRSMLVAVIFQEGTLCM